MGRYLYFCISLCLFLGVYFYKNSEEIGGSLIDTTNSQSGLSIRFATSNPRLPEVVFRFDPVVSGRPTSFYKLLDRLNYGWKNENPYIEDVYDCKHFAYQLYQDALRDGFDVRFVGLYYSGHDVGHALNAFRTTDRGIVFVDFTAVGNDQGSYSTPSKSIAWVREGQEYMTIPTYNLPDTFTNSEGDFLQRVNLSANYKNKIDSLNARVEQLNAEIQSFNVNSSRIASRNPAQAQQIAESLNQRQEQLKKEQEESWFENKRVVREGNVVQTGKIVKQIKYLPSNF